MVDERRYALCIEQTLGHRAHSANLQRAVDERGRKADLLPIAPALHARMRLPWALQGSYDALRQLRGRSYDSVLFHTQSLSLLAPLATRGAPYVVSLDATPHQLDEFGSWYQHQTNSSVLETAKRSWYRQVLKRAAAVVTWSDWAMDSVRDDYDIDPARTLVAHPGAGASFFDIDRHETRSGLPTILFVGGQFVRKGGPALLEAFEALRDRARMIVVTEDDIAAPRGVTIRRDIRPNTTALHDVYAQADMFCLPTLGDCTPVAIGEAMAAGLPVVTTTVGSNRESVPTGTGLLVAPHDVAALRDALTQLIDEPALLRQMGAQAREHASTHMDASVNAHRILDLLEDVAR